MKKIIWIASLCTLLMLGACGGGESSGSGSEASSSSYSASSGSASSAVYHSPLTDKEAKIDFCTAPDATRYAYASNDGTAGELVVGGASGEKTVYTAPEDSGIYNPRWSPDGKLIAFKVLSPYGGDTASVFILNVEGDKTVDTGMTATVNRYLTNEAYYSWSSDSQKLLVESDPIAYWDVAAGKKVLVFNNFVQGSQGEELEEKSIRASFSPNGKKIAYTTMGEKDGKSCTYIKVYDIARATTGVASYSTIPASSATEFYLRSPVWISDTRVISNVIGRPNWYAVDATNGSIATFDPLGTDWLEVKPSPDGKLLAVVRGGGDDGYKFTLLDLATLAETPIEGAQGQHLDWSADGTTLINWGGRIIRLFGADDGKQSADTRHIPVQIYSAPIVVGDTVYYENKVS